MKSALRITTLYAVFASLWIIFSDQLIASIFEDVGLLAVIASLKGLLFVLVTGLLLYFQVRRELAARNEVIRELGRQVDLKEQLIKELHHRIKNNIQVVIGLMNLETRGRDFSKAIQDRIENKLISMTSVFNIVYDLGHLEDLSLGRVLEEYKGMSSRRLELGAIAEGARNSVESTVTCLLALDAVMEVLESGGDGQPAIVSSRTPGEITIWHPGVPDFEALAAGKDLEFIELQMRSIAGRLECRKDERRLVLRFSEEAGRRAAGPAGVR